MKEKRWSTKKKQTERFETFTANNVESLLADVQDEKIREILYKFYALMVRHPDDFRSEHTIKAYLRAAKQLLMGEISGANYGTHSRAWQAKAAINYLHRFQLIPPEENFGFTFKIKSNKEGKAKKRIRNAYMSLEELHRFLPMLPDTKNGEELRLACRFSYYCGARLQETLQVTEKDFTIEEDRIEVLIRSGKGDKERITLLPKTLFLQDVQKFEKFTITYRNARDLTWRYMQKLRAVLLEEAKDDEEREEIENRKLSFHSLRHCAATNWVNAGVPINEISAMLGHSDISITGRYFEAPLTSPGLKKWLAQEK